LRQRARRTAFGASTRGRVAAAVIVEADPGRRRRPGTRLRPSFQKVQEIARHRPAPRLSLDEVQTGTAMLGLRCGATSSYGPAASPDMVTMGTEGEAARGFSSRPTRTTSKQFGRMYQTKRRPIAPRAILAARERSTRSRTRAPARITFRAAGAYFLGRLGASSRTATRSGSPEPRAAAFLLRSSGSADDWPRATSSSRRRSGRACVFLSYTRRRQVPCGSAAHLGDERSPTIVESDGTCSFAGVSPMIGGLI
jgi:hypothetical protein